MYHNRCLAVLLVTALVIASSCLGADEKKSKTKGGDSKSGGERNPALLDPSLAKEKAPDKFKAKFTTTKGDFVIEVTRDWAPNGADRFYNLVKIGYFDDVAFFRNIEGFMVQFGINGDPAVNKKWNKANIKADPVKKSNKPGYVTYAQGGNPNSRTTQIFINFGNNSRLDNMSFSPFGQVVEGMDVVKSLYNGYGEGAPNGNGPDQGLIQDEGNAYLKKSFPKLDYVKSVEIVED
jgi:peptidyl-prolyl cis-trans isomerase A (cyclophilin A)